MIANLVTLSSLTIELEQDLDTKIVGVSVDSVEKHLDFSKSYGLDFPLLSDQGGKVSG